jgi:FtsP/CotA-like multicopper oxidase with cupredoxin domain
MKRRRFLQLAAGAAAGAWVEHAHGLATSGDLAPRVCSFDGQVLMTIRPGERSPLLAHRRGREVARGYAGLNDVLREPLRVRSGERLRFSFFNGGAAEEVLLHLPGHRFQVVALDGNPVPTPAAVNVLRLAAGERADAMVEMGNPGNWLLASLDDAERARGLGVRLEYAHQNELAQWHSPKAIDWSYTHFSASNRSVAERDQLIEMLYEKDRWVVDGQYCANIEDLRLPLGRRYRLRLMNATSRSHSVHLHHHCFELTRVNQIPVSGIVKDTVRLDPYNVIEADIG